MLYKVGTKCSHLSHCRDQFEACSTPVLWHSCWEVAESRLEFAVSKAACSGLRQMLTSLTVNVHSDIYTVKSLQYMLTFEPKQRPGRGIQRSRSSTDLLHSCYEETESRVEFAASKAACCGLRQMLSSLTVCICSLSKVGIK